MTEREERERDIAEIERQIADLTTQLDAERAALAALPKEPVRLRVENTLCSAWIYPCDKQASIAHIYKGDCEDAGIDPIAYAKHCASYGQPAPEAIPARELEALRRAALAAELRRIADNAGSGVLIKGPLLYEAANALDAARGVNP